MFIKIIWLERFNLFFFQPILELAAFFLFGSGIKQFDLKDFLKRLINENKFQKP
jgi:hypothetical protein